MNLQRRLKRVSTVLNMKQEILYHFLRPEEMGGSVVLQGEEGRNYMESINIKNEEEWLTIVLGD